MTGGHTDIFRVAENSSRIVASAVRAFQGKSQISVMSAILEKEPEPISAMQPLTPPALDHVIRRALAKDPDERWQSAADFKAELKWIAEGGSQAREGVPILAGRRRWEHASWLLAAAFFLLLVAGGAAWFNASNRRPPPMYFHASVPFPAHCWT